MIKKNENTVVRIANNTNNITKVMNNGCQIFPAISYKYIFDSPTLEINKSSYYGQPYLISLNLNSYKDNGNRNGQTFVDFDCSSDYHDINHISKIPNGIQPRVEVVCNAMYVGQSTFTVDIIQDESGKKLTLTIHAAIDDAMTSFSINNHTTNDLYVLALTGGPVPDLSSVLNRYGRFLYAEGGAEQCYECYDDAAGGMRDLMGSDLGDTIVYFMKATDRSVYVSRPWAGEPEMDAPDF